MIARPSAGALALALLLGPASAQETWPARSVLVVAVAPHDAEATRAFLPAIAAIRTVSDAPLVLAVDPAAPWRPELLEFLRRHEPAHIVAFGAIAPPPAPWSDRLETLPATAPADAPLLFATRAWSRADRAVLVDFDDRDAAFCAAVLAARLRIPLLPCRRDALDPAVRERLLALGVTRAFVVGEGAPADAGGLRLTRLRGAAEVARALRGERLAVEYLAAVNTHDVDDPQAPQLALAAVLLAVAREGALVPMPHEVLWKQRHPASSEDGKTTRRGSFELDGRRFAFMTEGVGTRQLQCRIDRDGDARFDGRDEGPLRSGAVLALGASRVAIDLDVDEHARGHALWITSPPADELGAAIFAVQRALEPRPSTLCLVGWPQTLPMAIVGEALGIDADLVSDLPIVQGDGDPFADLDYARFVAADLPAGTLLACRGFVAHELKDRRWATRFATAEWESVAGDTLRAAGLEPAGHHEGGTPLPAGSPLNEVALLSHGSHASWLELGRTYAHDSATLLAPCFVESSGCSVASLDQDPQRRSVVAQLLRNGALAFAGNTRRGTAQQELFRSEFLDGLLAGKTLGAANRAAINRTLVAVLERGETGAGILHYQLHAAIALGDPALTLGLPRRDPRQGARVSVNGRRITVHGPASYRRSAFAPLAEWGCPLEQLFTWRGTGLGVESTWAARPKRNADALVFTAELRTKQRASGVRAREAKDEPEALRFSGKTFIDEHDDGTRSLFWRVRLIDFDMEQGLVRAQRERADFELVLGR